MSADIGAYDPQTARMILETVKYLKANGFLIRGGQKVQPRPDAARLYIAYTYSPITARSGVTAGQGEATLKSIPGVVGVDDDLEDYPPSGTNVITVYNIASTEVASGKYIFVAKEFASGKWVVVLEDCGT